MQTILDGKALASKVKAEVKQAVQAMGDRPPCLAVILVGDDPASEVYVRNKSKDCEECGIRCISQRMSETVSQEALLHSIRLLNNDSAVDGILVQLPLPKHIDTNAVLQTIDPKKDVDCFHPVNVGKLYTGLSGFKPCTPAGIVALLDEYNIPLDGEVVTVVGRSNIVGKPLAAMLLQRNATVIQCHSHTPGDVMHDLFMKSDIIVSAVGDPKYLARHAVCGAKVLIDVAMNRNEAGKLCGDFPAEWLRQDDIAYTPVPGGVGPMTRAMLMKNTLEAARSHHAAEN